MWKSKWRRSYNLPSKGKQPPYRPFLEQLEHRRLFATNITQYHVDYQSTGANLTETQLTSSNVNVADFGQLYNTPVDGQVYAEPLILTNVTIGAGPNTVGKPGNYNSVVFVATQHDSLYAINAANGAILWQRTFLDTTNPNDYLPGATSVSTVSSGDVNTGDINPEIGISGTPVIDPSTNTLYLDVKTKEIVGADTYFVQRLHAINITDGSDRASSFLIGSTINGNTNNTPIYVNGNGDGSIGGVVQFNALREANRPALSLINGTVYVEWASHGDNGPYHGWVATWNITNLSTQGMVLTGVLNTDPNGSGAGIWGGGGGLTFEPDGSAFYFETGNGFGQGSNPTLDFNGFPINHNYYESLVKVQADPSTSAANQNSNGWGLKVVDYFMPYNVVALDNADEDFGSGSPLVLPDSAGIPGHLHLMVAAGKEGKIYLIDRDNMGKFNANGDNVLNAVYNSGAGISTPPVLINGSLSTPAYYHGMIYWVSGYGSNAWSYLVAPNPAPNPPTVPLATIEPTSETANGNFGYVPGSVMVSANGSEDPAGGIVWIMDRNNNELHAYSSLSLSTELWVSGAGSIATVKFAVPTVANGEVFVGTQNSLQVFGLIGPSTPAQAPNAPANVSAQALSGSAVELNWTDSTLSPSFATNYAIQESTDGLHFSTVANAGQESTSYTVTGLNLNTTYYFQIVGSNSAGSSDPSNIASATTTNQTGQTPTAPVGLGATPASGTEVYLTWTNTAANETGFTLTRATDKVFTQNVITEKLASAPYYYTDVAPGLSPGNTYYYKLQSTNSSGLSSSSNTASVHIPNVPPSPTNAAAVANGSQIEVSWTDHAGPFALGYQISRSVDGGPYTIYAERPETSDAPPSTQTYTDTNVASGHLYSYEIVAENVAGFSAPAFVSAAALVFSNVPTTTTAGSVFALNVKVEDVFGSTITGYAGMVHFTSSDPKAVLPADYTFSAADQGIHSFSFALNTAGSQSITATATATAITSLMATTTGIAVTPASAAAIVFSNVPTATTTGSAFTLNMKVEDAYGNIVTGYTGTVHFTSSDALAVLPADYTFTAANLGVHSFAFTFKTVGSQSINATDTTNASVTVSTPGIDVINPFVFSNVPTTTTTGSAFTLNMKVEDAYGNIVTGYTGTVHFTSSDPLAVLPADYTFTAANLGVHSFAFTFKTVGSQTITVSDTTNASATGSTAKIEVTDPIVFSNAPTTTTAGRPFTLNVKVEDAYGNIDTGYTGTVHFTSSDPKAGLPADYTFTAADQGMHVFTFTLWKRGSQLISATDTLNSNISGRSFGIVVNSTVVSQPGLIQENFVVNPDYTISGQRFDASGNPTGSPFQVAQGSLKSIAVGRDPNGNLVLFGIDPYKGWVWELQFYANGVPVSNKFTNIWNLGALESIAVGNTANGNLELFAVDPYSHLTWSMNFDLTDTKVAGFTKVSPAGLATTLTIGHDAKNNPLVFTIDRYFSQVQELKFDFNGNPVGDYFRPGTPFAVKSIAVGNDAQGNAEVFAVDPYFNHVFYLTLDVNSNAASPFFLQASPGAVVQSIAVGHDSNNNPLLFAIGLDYKVYVQQFDGTGQPAGDFRSTGMTIVSVTSLQVGYNQNGFLDLFGAGFIDNQVYMETFDGLSNTLQTFVLMAPGAVNGLTVSQ